MLERGLTVDHTTVYRWVQAYAPELDKRCRAHLLKTNDSWRVDETYIKVKGEWKYLYRAVDSQGNKIGLYAQHAQEMHAKERFFRKVLKSTHNQETFGQSPVAWARETRAQALDSPRVINVDKNAVITPSN